MKENLGRFSVQPGWGRDPTQESVTKDTAGRGLLGNSEAFKNLVVIQTTGATEPLTRRKINPVALAAKLCLVCVWGILPEGRLGETASLENASLENAIRTRPQSSRVRA